MEYTVHKLAKLAGTSTRTLRYYDEIDILKPARINSSGYRIYSQNEVDRLQQILFYRELGVSLEQIKEIITSSDFDELKSLKEHCEKLLEKSLQLNILIANVKKTIASKEGKIIMSNKEKFEGFKNKIIKDNEKKYGEEIRSKYGNDTVDSSNQKVMNMSQNDYEKLTKLQEDIMETLVKAMKTGDPASELGQKAVDLHKQWLTYYWDGYSKEAHAGIGQMYVDDERFTAYYDKLQPGTAKFLRDAIYVYTGIKQ
jgi:DNA-binding transcriptional MerR regulator